MSICVLIGFGLLLGVLAMRYPGVTTGVVLGAHGYISSVGYLTELPWSAVGAAGTISGLAVLALARWQNQSGSFPSYRQLLSPIALLGCVFAIGAFQEYARGSGAALPSWTADGVVTQLGALTRRDEENGTWIVITRWAPYMCIAVLGCVLGGPGRFMTGFSLSAVLQTAAIPYAVFVGLLIGRAAQYLAHCHNPPPIEPKMRFDNSRELT